jgi:hypothetical protein
MAETSPHTPISSKPGDDVVIGSPNPGGQLTLLNALRAYKREGDDAKKTRMNKNRENMNAYLSVQDFSHKNDGQSQEFLPKTSVAVEQFTGFIKRSLTQFGAYFDIELPIGSKSPISGTAIRALMNCFLDNLLVNDNTFATFPLQVSDGVKTGALESLMIFKIHGNMVADRVFTFEEGDGDAKLESEELDNWKLRIDLVDPKNYGKDPTGAGLYEYHTVEKDLHRVIEMADAGIYDKAAVDMIENDFKLEEELVRQRDETGQDDQQKPGFRKKVVIDEFWCSIIDNEGKLVHKNVFCAMANNKYVIRKPTPNPFWHGKSPFVAIPLIRVPFSQWHKALFDDATQINFAMNEIYNLIIDGGISAVWGIKQVRIDDLEDPSQVSGGVPQGETLAVKSSLPHGQKVIEKVAEGEVPGDAMAVLEMLSREFAASALSSELKLGQLPGKQVKATEIVELSQSQAVTLDGIVADIEQMMTMVLERAWLTILQNIDDLSSDAVINAVGPRVALTLAQMSPAERFTLYANNPCAFKVHGLSSMLSKTRDFQKFMALLQAVTTNPLLFQSFFKKYSPDKVLNIMMKMLGINPERIEKDDMEIMRTDQDFAELQQLLPFLSGGPTGGPQAQGGEQPGTGGDPFTAEIAAVGNPTAGLAGAGNS